MDNETKQPTVSNPLEHVVSSDLVQAEYDGYRGYHKFTLHENNPYKGEKGERWALGFRKARVDE
jgi:hypothetical protein